VDGWRSRRHLTAIARRGLSMPARQALRDGIVKPSISVLDYGSGRGQDVRLLRELGVDAVGWDPHFTEDSSAPVAADVVSLLYVINVIEDAQERRQILEVAWGRARRALVVSARLVWERHRVRGTENEDGVLTSRGTFQKLFAPSELRSLVQEVTGARVVATLPGVVYAFRSDRDRLALLARRAAPNVEWAESTGSTDALAAVVDFLEQRGRSPRSEEIPDFVHARLADLPSRELDRLTVRAADPAKVEASAKRSILNVLHLLAVELFNGRGPFSELPVSVRWDVRTFFRSYREACRRADRLLLKIRDDDYVRGAMRNSVGKLTPTALYVHRRATDRMPVVLRLYEHCGAVAAGRPGEWSVLKLHHDQRRVTWLNYPQFDSDPHPKIRDSYGVDLKTLDASFRSYEDVPNKPLLHRKHEFLAPDDPEASKYRRLTDAELRAGLYERPHLIGTENGWAQELDRCGVRLRGHRLVRVRQ
jgi:DNA phosphorothioation-associated putative methyltransferase